MTYNNSICLMAPMTFNVLTYKSLQTRNHFNQLLKVQRPVVVHLFQRYTLNCTNTSTQPQPHCLIIVNDQHKSQLLWFRESHTLAEYSRNRLPIVLQVAFTKRSPMLQLSRVHVFRLIIVTYIFVSKRSTETNHLPVASMFKVFQSILNTNATGSFDRSFTNEHLQSTTINRNT